MYIAHVICYLISSFENLESAQAIEIQYPHWVDVIQSIMFLGSMEHEDHEFNRHQQ